MTRTFSRAEWLAAQAEWDAGEFGPEWRGLRHAMALRGAIRPPEGSRWDDWSETDPSQRAVVARAMSDTPRLLAESATRAKSWPDLVRLLVSDRDRRRAELDAADADAARRRELDREADRRSLRRLADVLATVADSGTPL